MTIPHHCLLVIEAPCFVFWQVWVKIWKRDQTGHRKRSANEFGRKILDVIALGALEAQRTPTREGPGIRVVQVGREIVAREGKGCLTCFLSMQDVRPAVLL